MLKLCQKIDDNLQSIRNVRCEKCKCSDPLTKEQIEGLKLNVVSPVNEQENFIRIEECGDCAYEKRTLGEYLFSEGK